jgi:prenyltransferase beta subunit
MHLMLAFLFLFGIGSVLSYVGHSMVYEAGTAMAGLTPGAESHSGQVISAVGFLFILGGLVVAVAALVRTLGARDANDGSPPIPGASELVD